MYLIALAETPTFTTREAERGDELGSGLDQFDIGKVWWILEWFPAPLLYPPQYDCYDPLTHHSSLALRGISRIPRCQRGPPTGTPDSPDG